jgi:DNA-binding transcriptional ArsR family regulator
MSVAALEVINDTGRAESVLHPARLRLLKELAEPDSAAGLARRLGLPRQAVTYHVRQLEADGLVELVEERRKRNCTERVVQATARAYVISPDALGILGSDPERITDRFSSAYLVAVAANIIRQVGRLRQLADAAKQRLATLTMQVDIRFATPADQHAFASELADAIASLARKYHTETAPAGRRFSFVVAGFPNTDAALAPRPASPTEGPTHA